MNKVILMGRLTKDPELKQTPAGKAVCSFTIAVDRRFKAEDGTRQADFINCVAWEANAKTIGGYFHKGSRIAIVGKLQSRSYDDQNGQRKYVTEVIVDELEFVDTKAESNQSNQQNVQQAAPAPQPQAPVQQEQPVGFAPVEQFDAEEGNLPFELEDVGF